MSLAKIPLVSAVLLVTIFWILFHKDSETRSEFPSYQRASLVHQKPPSTAIPRPTKHYTPSRFFPLSDLNANTSIIIAGLNESVATELKRQFWEKLRPGFTCPPHLFRRTSKRETNLRDYALCGFHAKLPHCLVYSFGVESDSGFEADLLTTTKCGVFAYDPSVDHMGAPFDRNTTLSYPRLHFKKVGFGAVDMVLNGMIYRTLKTLMRDNGGHEWIDILKIDVEGAEAPGLIKVLEDWPSSEGNEDAELPFGQLTMELHPWEWQWNLTKVVEFLQRLEASGLRLFDVQMFPVHKHEVAGFAIINVKKLHKIPGFENSAENQNYSRKEM